MSLCLQIVAPEFLGSPDVPALCRFRASEQQEDDGFAVLAEVDPIPGPNASRASHTPEPTLL